MRQTRHVGHCWRSKEKLIRDVLQWTPTRGRVSVGRPARTYLHQLCADTGHGLEDLPESKNDRGWMDGEIQGNSCSQRDLMVMMMKQLWLQVTMLNTNNLQLYDIKYSYQIQIIYCNMASSIPIKYKSFLNRSIWPIFLMNSKNIVIYWPSTEPTIKRCTCVNKQKNNGSR